MEKSKRSRAGFLLMPVVDTGTDIEINRQSVNQMISFERRSCSTAGYPSSVQNSWVCSLHEGFDHVYVTGKHRQDLRAGSGVEGYLNPTSYKSFAYFTSNPHTELLCGIPDRECFLHMM